MHYEMLFFLLKNEQEEAANLEEEKFKASVMIHRPDWYQKVYAPTIEDVEEGIEMTMPKTEGDVQRIMAELRDAGFAIDDD